MKREPHALGPRSASAPPATLARDLFHERMHLQLFIDRAVPSSSSLYLTRGMANHLAAARGSPIYKPLLADLARSIRAHTKGNVGGDAKRDATEIMERITEEKFIIDATQQSKLGSRSLPPSPSDLQRQYLTLTRRWLVTYLHELGVGTVPNDEIDSIAGRLMALWLAIDAEALQVPRYPVPQGMLLEPSLLPLPVPEQIP